MKELRYPLRVFGKLVSYIGLAIMITGEFTEKGIGLLMLVIGCVLHELGED